MRVLRSLALGLSLALVVSAVAYADEVLIDGDGELPWKTGGQAMALGTICLGKEVTRKALVAPVGESGDVPGETWVHGTTVTLSVAGTTDAGLTATLPAAPGNQLLLPDTWNQVSGLPIAGTVESTVKFTPSNSGSFFGQVRYQATGPSALPGHPFTDLTPMNVTATVVTCPSITIATPASNAKYVVGSDVTADYSCASDSTITSCAGPVPNGSLIDTATLGEKSFTVTSTETDGGYASKTVKYRVVYPFAFVSPIAAKPAVNVADPGSLVTVKFTLSGHHGSGVLDRKPRHRRVECDGGTPLSSFTTNQIVSVKYKADVDRYVVKWQTKASWLGQCRELDVRLSDGTRHVAFFWLVPTAP